MNSVLLKQKDLFSKRWRAVAVRSQKEVELHIQLVAMLRWCLRPDVLFRHVPNGELRDPRTAAKLKAMGVLPGSADLEFFWKHYWEDSEGSHRALRVLFLELKSGSGSVSAAQHEFGLGMKVIGAEYHIARSIDEAIAILGSYGLIRPDVTVCARRW